MIELQQPIPIGTVVNVKGTPVDLMIVSQYPVTTINGVDGYFEFGAVALPLGLVKQELAFFNREDDVEKILFVGYIDTKFQEFINKHDEILASISLPRHSV